MITFFTSNILILVGRFYNPSRSKEPNLYVKSLIFSKAIIV